MLREAARSLLSRSQLLAALLLQPFGTAAAAEPAASPPSIAADLGPEMRLPSTNPAASSAAPGTGQLGRWLGLPADSALRLGGAWVGNGTSQIVGGVQSVPANGLAQQLLIDATLDLEQAVGWRGGTAWVQGLQLNAGPGAALPSGSVQGSNSLVAPPPLDRTALYSYVLRQDLWDRQLKILVGKQAASIEFANVTRPDVTRNPTYAVSALSALPFTPLYAMPTLLGRMPGYPDPALGASLSWQPKALDRKVYFNAGVFDGRGGVGDGSIRTGTAVPSLGGPLFSVAELGGGWSLGASNRPGSASFGTWFQGGTSSRCSGTGPEEICLQENGAHGFYGTVAQRLLNFRYGHDSSGLVGFVSAGWTPSITNLMTRSLTAGLTAFAPMAQRPRDSFGLGLSWARVNDTGFLEQVFRPSELMLQVYGQFHLGGATYVLPALTTLPRPGLAAAAGGSTSVLLQLITLF
ncbi:carbohydrate porin [Cyanobium sp. Morenito 9A2]|uniref:carbohydrate porin n=1 Tax=Cyanobium sp. Morenito 9A2 TaxID=2823718 RepID=UPI0020CC238E|nr:carbohydrate porin [Cyanobium sp. Morenito 9A2]